MSSKDLPVVIDQLLGVGVLLFGANLAGRGSL